MPKFRFRNSTTANQTPGTLVAGELAINTTDFRAWQGNSSAVVTKIVDTLGRQAANNVNITGGSIALTSLGNSSASTAVATSTVIGGTTLSAVTSDPASATSNAVMTNYAAQGHVLGAATKLKNVFTFTANSTYIKSGPDVQRIHVILCAGGGGGRAYSECGGAGGYAERILDATGITSVSVTVGGGGSGGAYFGFSPGGQTTSFGAFLSASGGDGANSHIQHNGGRGGLGSGGQVNAYGGGGGGHNNMDQYSPNCAPGGEGGIGFFGGGTPGAHTSGAQPSTVAAWGAGGVAVSPSHNGQGGRNGMQGICIVYEYK